MLSFTQVYPRNRRDLLLAVIHGDSAGTAEVRISSDALRDGLLEFVVVSAALLISLDEHREKHSSSFDGGLLGAALRAVLFNS